MDNFKVGDSVIGFYKINNEKIITNKSFIEFIDVRNRHVSLVDIWWGVSFENLITVKILLIEKKKKFYNEI